MVHDAQARERVELLDNLHLVAAALVRADDGLDGVGEVRAMVPAGEQVDVLAGPVDEAVLLDGVATGESEPEPCGGLQTDLGQTTVGGVHYPASARGGSRSGKRDCHAERCAGGSHRAGHRRLKVRASSHRFNTAVEAASRRTT